MMKEIGFTQTYYMTHIIWFSKNETMEHEKNLKKLLEYVNYGLSIMRQKNQKN